MKVKGVHFDQTIAFSMQDRTVSENILGRFHKY